MESLPQLHMDFVEQIQICIANMLGKTNVEQIKKKIAGCRTTLAKVRWTLDIGHFNISIWLLMPASAFLLHYIDYSLMGAEWKWCWSMRGG